MGGAFIVVRGPCKTWETGRQLQASNFGGKQIQKSAILGVGSGIWHLQKQGEEVSSGMC